MSESQTYIERLRALRKDMFQAMDGLDAAGLNWKPTRRETNSAFILGTHLLGSEKHWIHRVVGGREIQRDRDAEFRARGKDTSGFRDAFDAVARESEAILSRLSSADLDAPRESKDYGKITLRWCILHMIEHYAEHVGQISLTRQMWEEETRNTRKVAKTTKKTRTVKRKR